MCGFFSIADLTATQLESIGLKAASSLASYTQTLYHPKSFIPTFSGASPQLMPRWWQFIPRWNQSPLKQIKYASINARSETVADKPVYQEAWRQGQRCLIPTSSFYEFAEGQRVPGERKTPYRVTHKSQDLMMLAGLYEQVNLYSGLGRQTVTILTTQATETLLEIHERQPVTLDPSDWSAWLDPSTPSHRLKALLVGKQDLFTTKLASWQAEVQAYDKPSTILTND